MKMLYVPDWEKTEILEVETNGNRPDDLGFVKCEFHGFLGAHSLFPVDARKEVLDILFEREKLKKAFDDSVALVYQINNKYSGKKRF